MIRPIALSALLVAGGLLTWAHARSTGCFCTDCACTNCQGGCADESATRPACCRQTAAKAKSADDCYCVRCNCADCDGLCPEQPSEQR